MSESPGSNPNKSPSTIGLNPDAQEFIGESARREMQRKTNQQKKQKRDKKHLFSMNPEAKPWLPSSRVTGAISNKPVVLLLGVPGSGVDELGKKLAEKHKSLYYSGCASRREAEAARKKNFDNTPTSVWRETMDTLSNLDKFLSDSINDPSVNGYFLEVQCRNPKIIYYLAHVLKNHHLAPGHVLKLTGSSERIIKAYMKEEGEQDYQLAKRQLSYLENAGGNLAVFKDVMRSVTEICCESSELEDLVKSADQALGSFSQKTVAFAVPPTKPFDGVSAITDPNEYYSVLSSFYTKVSAGTTKWPGYREGGQLHRVESGDITNSKGARPSGDSHKVSLRTDGAKQVLLYMPVPGNAQIGRFYLIPKTCEVIFTISPKIGDHEYGAGKAPVYGDPGNLLTIAVDGELCATKSDKGSQQTLFIATDILYYDGEKRDRMCKYDYWDLDKRLHLLRATHWPLEDTAPVDSTTTVSLCLRVHHPLHKLPQLIKSIQSQDGRCTLVGITFTPSGKYVPHGDPNLFTWHAPKHKRIHLAIKKEDSEFVLLANKEWGSDEKVEIGRTPHIPGVPDGNAICRLQWDTVPGEEYHWDILGTAPDCWEIAGVNSYKQPKFWINPDEILEKFNFPVPPEARKLKVERVSDDDEETKPPPPQQTSSSGRGRGGHRGGR
eukprot:TRINITY_DN5913_c2_g1_i1.p1 TRINITY_DN5913_c2_g1~~TRINITY_DN5913_c2_g1_i1.p1  ORF type:complete len:690 (+),score=93.82 TRINITY_DN5913_c2_g1_i1:79-2070(+)